MSENLAMAAIVVLCLFVGIAFGQDEEVDWRTRYSSTDSMSIEISNFVIGPVIIDCETGEVTIEEGVEMDEASREFWRIMEETYPYTFPEEEDEDE